MQHAATSATPEHSSQQRLPSASCLWLHSRFHVSIGCDHRLIAFVVLPGNVPWMVVMEQDCPFGSGLLVPRSLASSAVDHIGPRACLAKGICAGVERIR